MKQDTTSRPKTLPPSFNEADPFGDAWEPHRGRPDFLIWAIMALLCWLTMLGGFVVIKTILAWLFG